MKVCALLALVTLKFTTGHLTEKFAWRELEFLRASDEHGAEYIPANNLPLAFDVWKDKIFLTVPRWKTGVVSTLNYIELTNEAKSSPILHPFPNLEMNLLPTEEENDEQKTRIISAFGIRVDECDRLWIVDSGVTNLLGDMKKFQNPSLFIFDLNTNELIRHFEIPQKLIKSESFFVNVFVDTQREKCEETFAYVADIYGYGVVVYDYAGQKSWRVNHNYFNFDPVQGNLNVGGVNFQWHDGIFGMALGKIYNDFGDRMVYFHALASTNEFCVKNSVLKNESLSISYHAFKLLGSRGPESQSSVEVFDAKTEVIFFTQINNNAIGCWNTRKPFTIENQGIVAADNFTLLFPNDLRTDSEGNLLILSNRMPLFIYSKLPEEEENFRILVGKMSELIKGTVCDSDVQENSA